MIVRHNWEWSPSSRKYTCVRQSDSPHNFAFKPDCFDCHAAVPIDIAIFNNVHPRETTLASFLDMLWSMKLRPMAALACLVEESAQ